MEFEKLLKFLFFYTATQLHTEYGDHNDKQSLETKHTNKSKGWNYQSFTNHTIGGYDTEVGSRTSSMGCQPWPADRCWHAAFHRSTSIPQVSVWIGMRTALKISDFSIDLVNLWSSLLDRMKREMPPEPISPPSEPLRLATFSRTRSYAMVSSKQMSVQSYRPTVLVVFDMIRITWL